MSFEMKGQGFGKKGGGFGKTGGGFGPNAGAGFGAGGDEDDPLANTEYTGYLDEDLGAVSYTHLTLPTSDLV